MGYLSGSPFSNHVQQNALSSQYQQLYLMGLHNSARGMMVASQLAQMPVPKPLYTVWRPAPEDTRIVRLMESLIGRIDLWRRVPLVGKWIAARFCNELETLTERMERHLRFLGLLIDAPADHPQPE